jgi:hypothetical protein
MFADEGIAEALAAPGRNAAQAAVTPINFEKFRRERV